MSNTRRALDFFWSFLSTMAPGLVAEIILQRTRL